MPKNKLIYTSLLCIVLFMVSHTMSWAAHHYVAQTIADCDSVCSSVTDAPCHCYTDVQAAINAADPATGDVIIIYPGDYVGNFILNKAVSIYGIETARVRFYASGASPALTIDSLNSHVSIKRITFRSGSTGILVRNSSATVDIKNNIFWLGTTGTGVVVRSSPNTRIINNTFYRNLTAISRDNTSIEIINNIFSNNTTNIYQGTLTQEDNISYNCFHPTAPEPNGTNYIPNQDYPDPDPKFVDPANGDFHLQAGSPCIDTGSPAILDPNFYPKQLSDMGAYGGPDTDTIPFPVSGLAVTSTTDNSVTVSWSPNRCYLIRGYRVYYDSDKSGPPYEGTDSDDGSGGSLPSPIDVGDVTGYTIANLDTSTTRPQAPGGLVSEPLSERLALAWDSVAGATGYYIYAEPGDCTTLCSEPTNKVATTATNSYILTGLINPDPDPHCYCIAVSAYAQAAYYIAVKPYYVSTDWSTEAALYSNEVTAYIGPIQESAKSAPIRDYPEPVVPNPDLPNRGCFIATAAYGYYSAHEVQALRLFRDRYLMTNSPGRKFIAWYYRHSPRLADYIDRHPALKPIVRTALMPAVGAAVFITETGLPVRLSIFGLITGIFLLYLRARRKGQCS